MARLDLKESSPSSPTPPSTTPPAPRAAAASANSLGGSGIGSTEGSGICHSLRARRPLHLAAQDPAHQLLRLRLPLLRQPRLQQRAARPLHASRRWSTSRSTSTGATTSRACSSPRASSAARLHDGAGGRGGAGAARGARLPRLHPPEDDPRGRAELLARGRALRRPAVASTSSCRPTQRPASSWRPEKDARGDPHGRWAGCALASSRRPPSERAQARAAPRFAPAGQSTQMIVGADAADDRDDPGDQRRRSTAPTGCGASTTRPSARSPTPAPRCRCRRRR